jgi:hypothetical protein
MAESPGGTRHVMGWGRGRSRTTRQESQSERAKAEPDLAFGLAREAKGKTWPFHLSEYRGPSQVSRTTLLPEQLDDFIAEDNLVTCIDVFVEALNQCALGFDGVDSYATVRPLSGIPRDSR